MPRGGAARCACRTRMAHIGKQREVVRGNAQVLFPKVRREQQRPGRPGRLRTHNGPVGLRRGGARAWPMRRAGGLPGPPAAAGPPPGGLRCRCTPSRSKLRQASCCEGCEGCEIQHEVEKCCVLSKRGVGNKQRWQQQRAQGAVMWRNAAKPARPCSGLALAAWVPRPASPPLGLFFPRFPLFLLEPVQGGGQNQAPKNLKPP